MRIAKFHFILFFFITAFHFAHSSDKEDKQVGLGFGIASPSSPVSTYALTALLEGTVRFNPFFGVSILATATSSPQIAGTYWFGSNGGYQQTFIEPRLYLKIVHVGFAVGLDLASNGGTIQGLVSYGPMAGIEIPIGRFSVGADARYVMKSASNPSPLSILAMFRFRL